MCICVNCRQIKKCKTYLFIEKQHNHINLEDKDIDFVPIDTLIQINIQKKINYITIDWDLIECLSFVEKPGSWIN